jgi:hypothetical protein
LAQPETWEFAVVAYDSEDVPVYIGVARDVAGAEKLRENAKKHGWCYVAVLDAEQREILPLEQVFSAIEREILNGKTYLAISKALRHLIEADLRVFQAAPTFFGLTADGGLQLAQMTVARLYDKSFPHKTVTIKRMLRQAELEIGSFKHGEKHEVTAAIEDAQRVIAGLQPILDKIKHRRDKWFAHLDVKIVRDPQEINAKANLTIPDLDDVFRETEKIVTALGRLFDGAVGEIRYMGGDDYIGLFERVRHSIDTETRQFAELLHKDSPDGPAPELK